MFFEKFVQFGKGFVVLVFFNQAPNGAESQFLLRGSPIGRVQKIGHNRPAMVGDVRRQQQNQKYQNGQEVNKSFHASDAGNLNTQHHCAGDQDKLGQAHGAQFRRAADEMSNQRPGAPREEVRED